MQIDQLKRRKFITLLGGEWFSELLYTVPIAFHLPW
jgi:hypothetical protein